MSAVNINIRTDAETKREAEVLFNGLGLNMTTAINVFLKKSIQYGGIPFEIRSETPNATTLAAMEESRRIANDESEPAFDSVEALRAAMGL